MLHNGWEPVKNLFTLPYHDIAIIHGLTWLALLTVADAIISPSGCGNIYMESGRTVISNIHRGGLPPVEAAAVIAELVGNMTY